MNPAAKHRRKLRKALYPLALEYLTTRSAMRFRCRPSQLKAAARQIAFRTVAHARRVAMAQQAAGAGTLVKAG